MNDISTALAAIEAAGATGTGNLLDQYRSIRPHLAELVSALKAEGGDQARIGTVMENLLMGADSVASGSPDAAPAVSDAEGNAANAI